MTLSLVTVSNSVKASLMNQIIKHINNGHGRAIFTASGIWTVPDGVYQFLVYLVGGGGGFGARGGTNGNSSGSSSSYTAPTYNLGGDGADSPLCSKVIVGQAIGSTFIITIGAAGANNSGGSNNGTIGGNSTFGTLLTSDGGGPGIGFGGSSPSHGVRGSHNGEIAHGPLFVKSTGQPYGQGAIGGKPANVGVLAAPASYFPASIPAASAGICVIEW